MGAPQQLMYSYAAAASSPAIEDYFSAYTYTGNGVRQTITTGVSIGDTFTDPNSATYTAPGTYTWVAPAGVTSVSVVCVGMGGTATLNNHGGGGGGLGYKNNYTVTPGNSYTVVIDSTSSRFISTAVVCGYAGAAPAGGGFVGDGGGTGGNGGLFGNNSSPYGTGGGGAGGYSGNGGKGADANSPGTSFGAGSGGAAAGGGAGSGNGDGGGGVGIYGSGSSGTVNGAGGSGGQSSIDYPGANYGGGGGAQVIAAVGGSGAVRIIWPGNTRSFPSTNTAGVYTSNKGGMVWIKSRDNAIDNVLTDTIQGPGLSLLSNNAAATTGYSQGITAFSNTGFDLSIGYEFNSNSYTYVGWSFAQGPKFFKVAQVVVSGSNQTVDLSSLGTVGMVTVKRTDSTSDWYTWHKDLSAGNLVYLNLSNAQASLGHITVSGTTLTLVQSVIGNGTYIVYAWAHDSSAGGMIQCGSFTTDGSGDASVTLGWEPQFVLVKQSSAVSGWILADSARGISAPSSNANFLTANTSNAEFNNGGIYVNSTGFTATSALLNPSTSSIYLAIRRGPMKPPTVGTQVYNAIARTGTGVATTITGVGFPPDLAFVKKRSATVLAGAVWLDRLRGATKVLDSSGVTAEVTQVQSITSFNMDGVTTGTTYSYINANTHTYINWYLRRAPGVFDEVCYKATGANMTVTHNLTVAPEMMIIKERNTTGNWAVYYGDNTSYMVLNTTAIPVTISTAWNNTSPTSSVFSLGTLAAVNDSFSGSYVAYLFATLAGISKVGTYTGNGSSQTINCGFTTGARFILIKRTDSTGDWFVWDTTRGIVAGNDGHLSLNTTAAEITTDDSIDPDNSGYICNQLAATNINVTSATYIFLAFA